MTTPRARSRNRKRGTLEVLLVRAFAAVRQTHLERLTSVTIEVPDETGTRWTVKFTRTKGKQ